MLSLRSLALLILADHVKGFGTTDQEKIALNEIYNLYKTEIVLGKLHTKLSQNTWVRYDPLTKERLIWSPRPQEVLKNETTGEIEYIDQQVWELDEETNKERKKFCKEHNGSLREKGLIEASDYARSKSGSPTIIDGIPFRCVFNTFDNRAVMIEAVPYWSGNVSTVRQSIIKKGGKEFQFGKPISPFHPAIDHHHQEGGSNQEIHTLKYHHCRPKGFPGWKDENYQNLLKKLYELIENSDKINGRKITIGKIEYLGSSSSSCSNPPRYFHRCTSDGTIREYDPLTLTTSIYEPFFSQEGNTLELEEWYEELHESKRVTKRQRDEERGRSHKRRKLQGQLLGTRDRSELRKSV